MATDAPALYLEKLVRLLVGTRALGPAMRTRDGMDPYSLELDFRVTDPAAVQATLEWAREQAPYAELELASPAQAGVPVTVFARVEMVKLAGYLVEQVLLEETGQAVPAPSGALPQLVRRAIDETVGAGGAWASLVSRLRLHEANAFSFLRLIEADLLSGAVEAVIQEGISQTIGKDPAWPAFLQGMRGQVALLQRITRAIETGDFLAR